MSHESGDPELPVPSAQPRRIGSTRATPADPPRSLGGQPETPAPEVRVFEVRADTLYVSLAFVGVLVTLAYLLGKNTANPAPAAAPMGAPQQARVEAPGSTTALPATFQRPEGTTDSVSHDDAEPAPPAIPTPEPSTPPSPLRAQRDPSAPAPEALPSFAVRLQDQMTRAEADELAQHLQSLGYAAERLRVAARPRLGPFAHAKGSERFRVEVVFPDRLAAEAELPKLRRIEWKHRSFQDAYLVEPGK